MNQQKQSLVWANTKASVLAVCSNKIHDNSIGNNTTLIKSQKQVTRQKQVTCFGLMLFRWHVGGPGIVACDNNKCSSEDKLKSFGSSTSNYLLYYVTADCAIYLLYAEVDVFFI